MSERERWIGLLAGLGAASIWGGLYVVSKVVLDHIPPFTLLLIRLLIGGGVIGLFAWRTAWQPVNRRQWFDLLLVGFTGYGVSLGLQFIGTQLSTAANGAVITAATPAFVFLFAYWLLGERITPRRWLALGIATLGVLLVIDLRAARLTPDLFRGNLLLVGAGLTWALHSVLVRRASRELNTLMVSFWAFLGGLAFAIPASAWELAQGVTLHWSPGVLAGVLYISIISTALAVYLWNTAFRLLDAGAASLTFFAQPLVGTLLGVAFLGERLNNFFLAGGFLIGAGLWLSSGKRKSAAV
jgi:drug/metabolite transporter (DMT)-like permease